MPPAISAILSDTSPASLPQLLGLLTIAPTAQETKPSWAYFIADAESAAEYAEQGLAKVSLKVINILAPVLNAGAWAGMGEYFPGLKTSFNLDERLAMALNTGNAFNSHYLCRTQHCTPAQLDAVVKHLTESEWEIVQHLWDVFIGFKTELAAQQQLLYGVSPPFIPPAGSMRAVSDEGAVAHSMYLAGGYFPLCLLPAATKHTFETDSAVLVRASYFQSSQAGPTESTPLCYSIASVFFGLKAVIHQLAWQTWRVDSLKLLTRQPIMHRLKTLYGASVVKDLKNWIQAVAQGDCLSDQAVARALNALRLRPSYALLSQQVFIAAVDTASLLNGWRALRTDCLMLAIQQCLANLPAAMQTVTRLSGNLQEADNTINEPVDLVLRQIRCCLKVITWLAVYLNACLAGDGSEQAIQQSNVSLKAIMIAQDAAHSAFNRFHAYAYHSQRQSEDASAQAAAYLLQYALPGWIAHSLSLLLPVAPDWRARYIQWVEAGFTQHLALLLVLGALEQAEAKLKLADKTLEQMLVEMGLVSGEGPDEGFREGFLRAGRGIEYS